MSHIERLTRYIASFVDELAQSGIQHAVIAPGSRSTPLALTFTEHEKIREWILVDERSAAFFALGLAKSTGKPVALVCTSGTAAANFFPAIVEAYYSRVPLIVLTADRPHELRDVDAPQAIDQVKMYGAYAKWFHEMALPESSPAMIRYARSKAARSVHEAITQAGPVHLNFPLREPLVPDFSLDGLFSERSEPSSFYKTQHGKHMLMDEQLDSLRADFRQGKKGLLLVGPAADPEIAEAVAGLAASWNMPVLADPLSQLRSRTLEQSTIIETYDAILRQEEVRNQLKPDFIIRFGAMPVSKMYRFYSEAHQEVPQYIVTGDPHYREPSAIQMRFIHCDPVQFCQAFGTFAPDMQGSREWLQLWQRMNETARRILRTDTGEMTEGTTVMRLMEQIPSNSVLFSGNSMAIRDLDSFMFNTDKNVRVLCNRGANGIDGVVSTAAGAAAAGERTTLLIGDLSFYHDMNGLLAAKQHKLPLTIILVNNSGGGIFSFLPQSKEGRHFEALFGTPLHVDFKHAAALYEAPYTLAASESELESALQESYGRQGLSIIEVQTDRAENEQWHREKWALVNEAILKELKRAYGI